MTAVPLCLLAGCLLATVAAQENKQCGKVYVVVVDKTTAEKLPTLSQSLPKGLDVYSVGIGTPGIGLLQRLVRPGDLTRKLNKPEEFIRLVTSTVDKPCKGKFFLIF